MPFQTAVQARSGEVGDAVAQATDNVGKRQKRQAANSTIIASSAGVSMVLWGLVGPMGAFGPGARQAAADMAAPIAAMGPDAVRRSAITVRGCPFSNWNAGNASAAEGFLVDETPLKNVAHGLLRT